MQAYVKWKGFKKGLWQKEINVRDFIEEKGMDTR